MDLQEYDDIIRRLTAMFVVQQEKNAAYDALLEELRVFNRQQVEINARLEVTQARIEALLQRVVRGSDNGREA
jgi:hypothetical protein